MIKHDVIAQDYIAYHADTKPNKLATMDMASGRQFTYSEMNVRVGQLATYLKSRGISKGDRVAFLALNSTDILDILFAAWRIGASALALNFRLTASELEYIVNDAGPDLLFYDHMFADVVEELKPLVNINHYVGMDGLGGVETDLEKAIASSEPLLTREYQTLDEECMLMYSSGTTGKPKGVIITHGMIFYSAINLLQRAQNTAESVWLTVMPLFHIGGLNISSLPALWIGGTTLVMRMFTSDAVLDAIDSSDLGITHTILVPAMLNDMRFNSKAETTDFSRMVVSIAGGASVPGELVKWWYSKGFVICDGYGMTESAASNCVAEPSDVPEFIGTSGKGLFLTEMCLKDPDGNDVKQGEVGEIWMRGPTITPGYWNNEEANKNSFVDGWFKSGDIACQDEGGRYIIEDRSKDMYISGGENVYPAEVESVLFGLEAIADVAVIGVQSDRWGETGCAVVVLKDGMSLDIDEVHAYCEGKLGKFKFPNHLTFMEELPRTTTGKVKKFELRETIPTLIP
ncbi:AMP-binding protein [Kordiimonas laminariae]|uniref:AMP-binding protein n=1 Tax=Kordiimonas laminariae TaxID=2917717 RepID=UPI001FF624AE|nr:AMP-binding protein [Kordiimonas laminariae]MCK0070150.1 AMP-binding protein [Kordiimonas laminariae]